MAVSSTIPRSIFAHISEVFNFVIISLSVIILESKLMSIVNKNNQLVEKLQPWLKYLFRPIISKTS